MDYLRKSQLLEEKHFFSTLGTLPINGLLKEISISFGKALLFHSESLPITGLLKEISFSIRKALLFHSRDSPTQWIT